MAQATMFEAKTRLSDLVRRARLGEKVILTSGRGRTPVAEIVAIQPPAGVRRFDQFYNPNFEIPEDFDDLPEEEMRGWLGELE